MCTGRLVDGGPDRNSARLMAENEMMKAKIAPETRHPWSVPGGGFHARIVFVADDEHGDRIVHLKVKGGRRFLAL
jgi:hypothetical protein